ncbi:MAG: hypothetical protein ACSHW1_17795 [Yoonia sp.]|uniref:hypothetical protein n=1 Tax=Yoonia sp. TaxID=2212373 RepID=UPI003EF3277B
MKRTLILIFAALALMIGSFIWFVLSWDASKEESISFIWPNKLSPEGRLALSAPQFSEIRT